MGPRPQASVEADSPETAVDHAIARGDFRRYWFGQSVSVVGDQIAAFVLPTVAITVFGASALQVGVLNMLSTVSYTVLGLLVGALMDRMRRRPMLIAADLIRAAAFASIPVAAQLGALGLGQLYVVALVTGALAVLFNVASQSHLPTLLPTSLLATANSRMELSSTLAMVAGPTLGGVLVQWVGGPAAFTVNAASFLFSVAGVALLRRAEPLPAVRERPSTIGQDIREGMAALWRHDVLRRTTVASALRNFGNTAINTVLLLFAYRALDLSAGTAGVLFACGTVAAVAGASVSARLGRRLGAGPLLLTANAANTAWVFAPLALVLPPVPVLLVIRVVSSFSVPLWNATIATVRQTVSPAHLLGRISATAGTVNYGAIPLGALLSGLVAQLAIDWLGADVGLSLTLAGCGVVAAGGTITLLNPAVRRVRVT